MIDLIKRWGLFVFLIVLLGLFFYFHLYRYLTFASLKTHREMLLLWADRNFVHVILGFMVIYIVAVAVSIPGAVFLTLTAGFLFGPLLGTLSVVVSATMGAFIVFLAVKLALREWVRKKTAKWLQVMEQSFQGNAFSYLLFLRFIPLFPFWIVNIVPALLGMPKFTFVAATFIGIIPGSFVYVMVGNGLGHIFDAHETPNLGIIFDFKILLPLIALALLSLLPIGYKYFKHKSEGMK